MTTLKPSQLPTPCSFCKVRHVPLKQDIEIRDPDDEIVGHGFFHVERMDDDHVWIGFTDRDGGTVCLDVMAETGKARMTVQDER